MTDSLLSKLEATIDRADGVGVDDNWPEPVTHPAADASILQSAGIQGDTAAIAGSLSRLRETALEMPRGLAWGLNFPIARRHWDAHEPMVVTTALVGIALAALPSAMRDTSLENACRDALLAWPLENGFPIYCPTVRFPVANAGALWAASLVDLGASPSDPMFAPVRETLEGFHTPDGWRYSVRKDRIDLNHNAFIAMAGVRFLDIALVATTLKGLLAALGSPMHDLLGSKKLARLPSLAGLVLALAELARRTGEEYWSRELERYVEALRRQCVTATGELVPQLVRSDGFAFLRHVTKVHEALTKASSQ